MIVIPEIAIHPEGINCELTRLDENRHRIASMNHVIQTGDNHVELVYAPSNLDKGFAATVPEESHYGYRN